MPAAASSRHLSFEFVGPTLHRSPTSTGGASPHWAKVKNPNAPALRREEKDRGSSHWIKNRKQTAVKRGEYWIALLVLFPAFGVVLLASESSEWVSLNKASISACRLNRRVHIWPHGHGICWRHLGGGRLK
jgi:hypothetical protein